MLTKMFTNREIVNIAKQYVNVAMNRDCRGSGVYVVHGNRLELYYTAPDNSDYITYITSIPDSWHDIFKDERADALILTSVRIRQSLINNGFPVEQASISKYIQNWSK